VNVNSISFNACLHLYVQSQVALLKLLQFILSLCRVMASRDWSQAFWDWSKGSWGESSDNSWGDSTDQSSKIRRTWTQSSSSNPAEKFEAWEVYRMLVSAPLNRIGMAWWVELKKFVECNYPGCNISHKANRHESNAVVIPYRVTACGPNGVAVMCYLLEDWHVIIYCGACMW
jgi:hypothetical protein